MTDRLFDTPVFVKHSDYLVLEIASLGEAIDFLEDWPRSEQDLVHETVLRACHAAADGMKPLAVARKAFVDFARKNGLLEDPAAAVALARWRNQCAERPSV